MYVDRNFHLETIYIFFILKLSHF